MTLQEIHDALIDLRKKESEVFDERGLYFAISACADSFSCYRAILKEKGE